MAARKKSETFTLEQVQEIVEQAVTKATANKSTSQRDTNAGAFWVNTSKKAPKEAHRDYAYGGVVHVLCPHCEEMTDYSSWLRENKSGNKFPKDRGSKGGVPRWRQSLKVREARA